MGTIEVITEKLTWQHEGIHALSAPNSLFIVDSWTLTSIAHVLVLSSITDFVTGQLRRLQL